MLMPLIVNVDNAVISAICKGTKINQKYGEFDIRLMNDEGVSFIPSFC